MRGQPTNRVQYQVPCSCGTKMSLDAREFGRPRLCKNCGSAVTVAWGRDPKTRKTVPVAMVKPNTRTAAAPKSPFTAFCGCGYSRPVPATEANTTPKCPGCGKLMVVEKAPDPKSLRIQKTEKHKPAGPIVPLHLRPPLRVRVKPGTKFFECPCGERNLIRDGQIGKKVQCPACDRWHVVEELKESATATVSAPPTGKPYGGRLPAPPKPAAPSRPLRMGEALCPCGEILPPRTSRTGKNFQCKCGRKGHFDATTDEKGAMVMKAIVTEEPKAGAAPAAPAPSSRSISPPPLPPPSRSAPPPAASKYAPPPPRPAPEVEVSFQELAVPAPPPAAASKPSEGFFESTVEFTDEGEPAPLPEDTQAVICTCATELLVSSADVGQTIQCPMCSTVMTVEEVPDARGSASLRVRGIGTMDQDWNLDDFK